MTWYVHLPSDTTEICTFLRYYAAYDGEFLTDILGPIGWPEISVRNYHCMLRNILVEHRSYLLRGGSLKSRQKYWLAEKPSCPVHSLFLHDAATGCDHLQGAPNFVDYTAYFASTGM
jgi:hypothetical protein